MSTTLNNLVTLQIGYQHRERLESWSEGEYSFIQIKDFDDHRQLRTGNLYKVTPKRSADRYLVNQGDVLFLSRGHKLFASAITQPLQDTIAAYYFYILRLQLDELLPEYLAWYINQHAAQAFLESQVRGSHMKMVPKDAIGELPVEYPSIEIQRNILELDRLRIQELSLLDQIRDERNRLVEHICQQAAKSDVMGGRDV